MDFIPALCNVFSSLAILSATLGVKVFLCFPISVCMIFLYSSELHLSHAGLVYILAGFGANLLIWVVISTLMRVWSEVFIASNGMIETTTCTNRRFSTNKCLSVYWVRRYYNVVHLYIKS